MTASIRLRAFLIPWLIASAVRAERPDFAAFLARHDLIWEQTPKSWFEAPFLGNGTLGLMLFQSGPTTLRIEIGRGDAYDHRKADGSWHNRCRLPIGHFMIETAAPMPAAPGVVTRASDGVLALNMPKGGDIVLTPAGSAVPSELFPAPAANVRVSDFGLPATP